MVLKMVCNLFFVFYVCKFTFKEEKEDGCSIYPYLGCELSNSSRLVFVLHEASNEGDFDWHLGFRKNEEPRIYERRRLYNEGHLSRFGAKEEEVKFLVICCSLFLCELCALVF